MKKHILIVIDEEEKETFYGPFNSGEDAINWGSANFGQDFFICSTTIEDPNEYVAND